MTTKTSRYIEAIGRRKTATSRVRITPAKECTIVVNDKSLAEYFKAESHQAVIMRVFTQDGITDGYSISVHVKGGGLAAQAEAIRLGISRALIDESIDRRGVLKKAGYLKRDPRAKERKKFGRRKARKSPQWSKR